MFDADRPILTASQDRLNRAVFAKYLARCMLDHNEPESLVVGLYGSWGVGKTSLINLVLEELQFAATNVEDNVKPIILNFSAWSYSGQDQLVYSFFRRLSSTLNNVTYLENKEKIIQLLELYVSFFTHKPIPKPFRTKKNWLQHWRNKDKEDIHGWDSGRDLTQVKAELNEILRKQPHKIIIFIDNISRLYPKEIKQIFQIVKSMGDYFNTIYVLAFDKQQVIHALDVAEVHGGKEYVEKIIQLPFDIPPISQQDMENIFIARLDPIMHVIPEDAWNSEYWADVYCSSIKYFFESVRDITRYTNTLSFGYLRIKEVVNAVDFFALTALEVFSPEVYKGIRENKDLFTDLLDNVYQPTEKNLQEDKVRCDEILSRNKKINPLLILNLISYLFPRIRTIYFPERHIFHFSTIARKLKRVCSPDLFDAYFRLNMQAGYIPHAEFVTLLSLANNKKIFEEAITRLNQDNRVLYFLNLLDNPSVIESISDTHILPIVTALLSNGDLFPVESTSSLAISTHARVHRIIHALLNKLKTSGERFGVLQQAIANSTKSLFIMVNELKENVREHMEESDTFQPPDYRELSPNELESLRSLVLIRVQTWAKNGSLIDHPKLVPILDAWMEWGEEIEVREYVSSVTQTDRGLIAFLVAFLEKPILEAMTQYIKHIEWNDYLKHIKAFINPKSIEEHAKKLFEDDYFDKLREKEQLALMIFLDLMNTQTNKMIRKAVPE